jgi:type II secretory pathway component PulJ
MAKIDEKKEREIVLRFVELGRGHTEEKEKLAEEIGLSVSALKYKASKFKSGGGIGRKRRADAGIPKKEPELKIKLEFFAERAMGKSVDEVTKNLGLTEHQGNTLERQFKQTDKWKALRNAPQLEDLKDFISDVFRFDIALVVTEMFGAFKVQVKDGAIITIPVEELNDIKAILAHCVQIDEFAKIDPAYKGIKKDALQNARIYYLKEECLEKKDIKGFTQLHRATKPSESGIKPDLKLIYNVIERFNPGCDEHTKLSIIREEAKKLRLED